MTIKYGLLIDEETFNELYPDLVGHYSFFNNPPPVGISPQEFERRYLSNKLWRLNHVYTITDKEGNPVQFKMKHAQHVVYARARRHPRVIVLKSRQQGISTLWLVSYFDDAVFQPLLNIGMMAQGVDEASTLLERSKFLWDQLDGSVKNFIGVTLDKDNAKEFSFSNGSKIIIRVSFRSSTLQRLHVSEMGKIANNFPIRAKEVKTGTLQALARGNTGIIESTAEGMNMFKDMWDQAELALYSDSMSAKDFYPVFLSWVVDPDCREPVDQPVDSDAEKYFEKLEEEYTAYRRKFEPEYSGLRLTKEQKNFWIVQRRELGGDVHQEYPGTPEEAFTASRDGTYWSRQFQEEVVRKGNVQSDVYDPNLLVDVYLDIGVEDYGVLVFKQWFRGEYRIIDEYFNQNYDMAHYMDEAMGRGYKVRAIRFPHDAMVREYAGGNTGAGGRSRSRLDIAREKARLEGWDIIIDVVAKDSIANGVEAVRRMIPKLIIDKKCGYIIKCFQRYSKEWDEKLSAWKKTEKHDEWSHGAAALRYVANDSLEHASDSMRPEPARRRRTGYAV